MIEGTTIRLVGFISHPLWMIDSVVTRLGHAILRNMDINVDMVSRTEQKTTKRQYALGYNSTAYGALCISPSGDEGSIGEFRFMFYRNGKKHYILFKPSGFFEVYSVYSHQWKFFIKKLTALEEGFQNAILSERNYWKQVLGELGCTQVILCSDCRYGLIEEVIEIEQIPGAEVVDFDSLLMKLHIIDNNEIYPFGQILANKVKLKVNPTNAKAIRHLVFYDDFSAV